ncbi:Mitochondrial zinc maintenance protein 1, mitochondrial [Endocarpon pusillum]|uniref:Mitochondrial zinc maintenance protein 1, mitochondrial n=1 Tax=Endocarpon pusillum TaxID=364733 RepID=A0A8H7AP42_9EURO|nr:Mitochondrial zinc maintenance protein 1, mitochondrial [Endocarpon pusillum]
MYHEGRCSEPRAFVRNSPIFKLLVENRIEKKNEWEKILVYCREIAVKHRDPSGNLVIVVMTAALAAYRHLLRSTRIAFQGDFTLLTSARVQAREGFNKKRTLECSSKEATEAVKHAEDVAQILRHNIVQGEQQEGKDVLKLHIHKDTERGDNDTINLGGKTVTIGQGCS